MTKLLLEQKSKIYCKTAKNEILNRFADVSKMVSIQEFQKLLGELPK